MRRLILGLLTLLLTALPCLAENKCDLVSLDVVNRQFSPTGAFVGTTELTILQVDPQSGAITPTGQTFTINCAVTGLGFLLDGEYVTSHHCVGPPGSRIDFTAVHRGQTVPLENDPDGFDFALIDTGELVDGKGRWNCGADAVGVNPATGGFNAKLRAWTPVAPGMAVVNGGLARWCSCGED